jgi:hypothetical protein
MSDDWEDTGVGEVPRPNGQSASARAAFREIRALRTELSEHTKSDTLRLDSINTTLTGMRVEQAGTKTALEAMTSELRRQHELRLAEVQTEGTGQVEKQKTERERVASSTKVLMALIALGGTIAGIVGTYLAN